MEAIEKNIHRTKSEPLSTKVVKGGLWVFVLRVINRGLGFIRTIILARLLAPDDFGLLGIAMLSISTLETFSQTGFQPALIQKKENIESYLDTAWTISAIRGILLFAVLFLSAPVIARFFNSAAASLVIRVIALSTLLAGFRNIGIIFFERELEFSKQFLYDLSGTLVDLSVSIILAFILRNVWALVWGGLAANAIRTFVSYLIQPYRPRFGFKKEKFQDLFGYGKWVLGSSILIFLITQGDDILVGKMLGVAALGFYQMAYLFSNLPTTEITHVFSRVTIPAYSKLQDDRDRLKTALIKTLSFITFITMPLAAGICILTPEFTVAFLGEKWLPIVPAMQVLCLFGALRAMSATFGPIYRAVARVDIPFKISLIQLTILIIIIYPLSSLWGVFGTAIAVTVSMVFALTLTSIRITEILDIRFFSLFKPVFSSLFASVIMLTIIYIVKLTTLQTASYFSVFFLAIIGITSYLGLQFVINIIIHSHFLYPINTLLEILFAKKTFYYDES